MLPRLKVVINPYKRTNKKGEYSVMIRLTLGKQVRYLNTRIKIRMKYWREEEPRWIRESHPQDHFLNAIIKQKKDLLYEYACRLHFLRKPVTIDGLVEFYKKKGDPQNFIDFIRHHIFQNKEYKKVYNTWKKYKTFYTLLSEFNPDMLMGQLEENEFKKYIQWRRSKGRTDETISKDIDCWKVLAKEAVKEGYLDQDPFQFVRLGLKTGIKKNQVVLNSDELRRIRDANLADRPDLVPIRNQFLFCVYSCMYYSNLKILKWTDLVEGPKGYCIEASRTKNDLPFIAPIYKFNNAIQILELQRGKDPELIFPEAISEQKFNVKLKELAALGGIKKRISNKTARRSGATFYSEKGLETQFLKKIMGHTKESTTHEYIYMAVREVSNRVEAIDFSGSDF